MHLAQGNMCLFGGGRGPPSEIIALDKWNLSSINDCYKEIKLLGSKATRFIWFVFVAPSWPRCPFALILRDYSN